VEPEPAVSPETLAQLRDALSFRSPHIRATVTPSKQTATQLKGRLKDEEAAENTPRATVRTWRKPSFVEQRASGTAYGSAVHMALQHIHYDACGDVRGVEGEIRRLVDQGYLTAEQGALIPCGALARFFATEFGRKLCTGKVLREFKFSILDSATQYAPGLDDEQVLLQGVIDCALVESDGITVLDFKTDYVTEDTLDAVTAGYAPQVQVYADAISRIYGLPVKAKALYFFHLSRLIYL
jgi:ATP-dependent helicase/nuclease subunit A